MRFSVVTIHPGILGGFCSEGLLKKAQEKKLIEMNLVSLRDFADPPHFRVDDSPYGGGPGMVLKCEPIVRAVRSLKRENAKRRVIVLSAKGKKFTQNLARKWSKLDDLILICGRYEGIDERVIENYVDEEVRIGDYVLMGGEVAAAVIIEAVARQVPGVLGNPESIQTESFSKPQFREHAQFTRPPVFEGHKVPDVMLKGNHSEIQKWRDAHTRSTSVTEVNSKRFNEILGSH